MDQRTVIVEPEPFECVPHGLLLNTGVSATTLRVYLILRKHRNYDTGEAWPGLSRIGELIGLSADTVRRSIKLLVEAGYMCQQARFDEHGGQTSNLYHVHFDIDPGCTHFAPSTHATDPLASTQGDPVAPMPPKQRPISKQNPSNEEPPMVPHPFDEFWSAYPRKLDKGHARKAFTKAAGKVDPAVIVAAAVRFRQWCEQDRTDPKFIPHASTWLNGERWNDERDPARATKQDGWVALFAETVDNSSQGYPQLEG